MVRNVRQRILAILLVALSAVAGGSDAASQWDDEAIDFIRFDGAVYLSLAYFAEDLSATDVIPVAAEEIGPTVGQVVTNRVDLEHLVAEPNEPCLWPIPDGAAPRLAPGDDIYAIRGYATTFRLAARQGESFVAYQVWCNDRAAVGADLFDIYDRVERIRVTGDTSESSGWAVIDDPATIADLVGMILEGPVIPAEETTPAPVTHQLIVYLEDGTAFRASAAPGELLWGLGAVGVPAAFTVSLDRAWRQQQASGA